MPKFTGTSGDDEIRPGFVSAGVLRTPAGSFPGDAADTIFGRSGEDGIVGGGGDDTIYGGDDQDFLYGGAGDDYLHGNEEGQEGDYVVDWLSGDAGNDTLVGGGAGAFLYGGTGNDTYYFQSIFDLAEEKAGEGTDTVILRVDLQDLTLRLADYVENLVLATGVEIENARGNALDNVITGNSGANGLYGYEGKDTLDGGAGADRMEGGTGNDTYYVERALDKVVETSASGGTDKVYSSVSLTLGANVEHLVLTGSAASGTGNGLANGIAGNAGANSLAGMGGDDTLFGDEGADTLRGGDGADSLMGGRDADVVIGGKGGDTFRFADTQSTPATRDVLRAGDGAVAFEGAGAAKGDRIDVAAVDADSTKGGDQAFVFDGTKGKGHLWVVDSGDVTLVRGNVDGDSAVEFEFEVAVEDGSVRASAYTHADFLGLV